MGDSHGINGADGNGQDAEPVSGATAAAALAARTLRGDLRDRLLEFVRRQKQPWSLLNEEQQTGVVGEVTRIAGALVDGAVAIVASRDFPAIVAKVRDCKAAEKGIEAKLVLASHDPFRHALMDAVGSPVQIVLADPAVFYGARGLAAIDPDEPELPLANGDAAGAGEVDAGTPAGAPGAEPAPVSAVAQLGEDVVGPYNAGYDAARRGEEAGANPYEFGPPSNPGHGSALLWFAGWYQCRIDIQDPGLTRNDVLADAVTRFSEFGYEAAAAGEATESNPLASWMLAHKWWMRGWHDFGAEQTQKKKRGRPRGGRGAAPGAPA